MKTIQSMLAILLMAVVARSSVGYGQTDVTDYRDQQPVKKVSMSERNMGGPRIGITMIPGNTPLAQELRDNKIGRVISQFGWHFEWQVVPSGGGPSFVIQFVPMFGGVEYKTIVPSFTLPMGVRFPDGIEFGLGPNLVITKTGAKTSLVAALGKSFDYGGVSIPVNLVVATNPDGNRFSIVFGYAID